jgi:carotenoid cleavage dioxygenase-like enzyme
MFTDELDGYSKTIARRITIPLDSAASSESIYCNIKDLNSKYSLELPNINYSKYNSLPYKYAYGVNIYKKPYSVVKINVNNPEESWHHEMEKPNEPIFVENPNGQSEDDGVLLCMCQTKGCYYLSILDAKDMKELARVDFKSIPAESVGGYTFHGFFADDKTYKDLI